MQRLVRFNQRNIRTATTMLRNKSTFTLPQLPYDVKKGVEPCITPTQLDYHYNKHHQTYVDNINKLMEDTNNAHYEGSDVAEIIVKSYQAGDKAVFNNIAQHFNHSFYWRCMKPNPNKEFREPTGKLQEAIIVKWGSVEDFKKAMKAAALSNFGSGWTWLTCNQENELQIWNSSNAETPVINNQLPLLVIDVWEHAYYLDHQNRRAEYFDEFWNVINWEFVESVYDVSSQN